MAVVHICRPLGGKSHVRLLKVVVQSNMFTFIPQLDNLNKDGSSSSTILSSFFLPFDFMEGLLGYLDA